jgi:hypothetical protein
VVASVVIFAVSAGILAEKFFLKGVRERAGRMQELHQRAAGLGKEIAALEETYPCRPCAGPPAVDLREEDVDRYLAVRAALAPHLASLEEVAQEHARKLLSLGPQGTTSIADMLSMAKDPLEATKIYTACLPLLEEALVVLQRHEMGPRELTRLAGMIEFGFLGREEAAWLTLTPEDRESYWSVRSYLALKQLMVRAERMKPQWMQGGDLKEHEDEVEQYRPQVAYLERRARAGGILSEATRDVLEHRRPELEALSPDGVRWLGALDARTIMMVAMGLMMEPESTEGRHPVSP